MAGTYASSRLLRPLNTGVSQKSSFVEKSKKKYKYAVRAIKSTQLGRALDKLKNLYIKEDEPDYLVIPYVLTCAAYLEAKLNDSLIDAEKQYGEELSSALMSLSLPNKLKILVPVLTGGKYEINKEHFVYQRLISLIRVRNTIAHAKSELKEISVPEEEAPESFHPLFGFKGMPSPESEASRDITLGASKTFSPLEYHEALNKLEKWFFFRCPDRLEKVAMVNAREKIPQWEEQYATFVKHFD